MLLVGVSMLGATKSRIKIKIYVQQSRKKMAFLLHCLMIKYKYRAKSPPLKAPWHAPLCFYEANIKWDVNIVIIIIIVIFLVHLCKQGGDTWILLSLLLLNCIFFVFVIVNNEIVKNTLSESALKYHIASIIKPYVKVSVIQIEKNINVIKNS